jgi:alpha-L-fucosidase
MSGPELARYWTDVVARGGHLLLNVGPTAEGEIPEVQRRALEEFASWRQGVGDVAEVAAWDEPAHARGPADGPWVRYWRLPGEVVALVGDAGRHSLTLPTGQTVEVVVDDVSKGPAALRFPA